MQIYPTDFNSIPYTTWLKSWKDHLPWSSPLMIPTAASKIHAPLVAQEWESHLQDYPNRELTRFFLEGITQGFKTGFKMGNISLKSATKNLPGALLHPEVVDEYLQHELSQHRLSGPYPATSCPCPQAHISRFGVIPKNHQPRKWRLIVDLSHPAGHSINNDIPPSLCSLSYITVDDAIQSIIKTGPGTSLAKIDIKSAFRLLPICPSDRHLVAMQWRHQVYIDTCLPFGLRSAPKLFNILADLLAWIAQNNGVTYINHYLDDFLTMGPPDSTPCKRNLEIFIQLCKELDVPLATEKIEDPSTTLTFLGIILDTEKMEIRLPDEKLKRIKATLQAWLEQKKATKRQILSLVGLLQHATKVVKCGRTFVARLYATAAKLKEMHYYTRLNAEFRSDLMWWHAFVQAWNGLSILHHIPTGEELTIYTDASGAWGCGAICGIYWFQWQWPEEWKQVGIMCKELASIVLSCAVWGPTFSRNHVLFRCDNLSLVNSLNKGSSKDPSVMQLLRTLWLFTAYFDISITTSHVPGAHNSTADHLSRNNLAQFRKCKPNSSALPHLLPPPLLQLVSLKAPDWTSPKFNTLFQQVISALHRLGCR